MPENKKIGKYKNISIGRLDDYSISLLYKKLLPYTGSTAYIKRTSQNELTVFSKKTGNILCNIYSDFVFNSEINGYQLVIELVSPYIELLVNDGTDISEFRISLDDELPSLKELEVFSIKPLVTLVSNIRDILL